MSRVGKQPITIPSGVTVAFEGSVVTVTGTKGTLTQTVANGVRFEQVDGILNITRDNDEKINRSNHGLMRALLQNMITGVSAGFSKKLELHGVGYRVAMAGSDLKLNVGVSHDVLYKIPSDINVSVEQNTITISGIDKQKVGQVAAEIRALKKPEPYKGKGIRYSGEHIIRKSGKSGKDK